MAGSGLTSAKECETFWFKVPHSVCRKARKGATTLSHGEDVLGRCHDRDTPGRSTF